MMLRNETDSATLARPKLVPEKTARAMSIWRSIHRFIPAFPRPVVVIFSVSTILGMKVRMRFSRDDFQQGEDLTYYIFADVI